MRAQRSHHSSVRASADQWVHRGSDAGLKAGCESPGRTLQAVGRSHLQRNSGTHGSLQRGFQEQNRPRMAHLSDHQGPTIDQMDRVQPRRQENSETSLRKGRCPPSGATSRVYEQQDWRADDRFGPVARAHRDRQRPVPADQHAGSTRSRSLPIPMR